MSKIIQENGFRVIASEGLGRASNTTAHSVAFFRGQLYVGTSCGSVTGSSDSPRILRFHAEDGEWETVYESPLVPATKRARAPDRQLAKNMKGGLDFSRFKKPSETDSNLVPRDAGFRSMCVFKGRTDAEPALYVSCMSRFGGQILRSEDGVTFEPVGEPGFGNPDIYSFRGLTVLGDRLFTAPAGTTTDEWLDRNLAPEVRVYVTDDPASGRWEVASPEGFGDPANMAIYALATAHGMVYGGTANPERGMQVWRTSAEGTAPFTWEPVVVDGAGAFNHNLAVTAMTEFKGALYVGGGITGFGYDTVHDIGPASAEMIRIHPDKSWDLIAGRMRFTPDGLKVPLSLLGPGLDDFYNSVIWSLGVHDGVIYLGTHQWEAFRSAELGGADVVGGYQLWASEDGENWQVVIADGHGNPAEIGVRNIASTPLGLVIGTNNQKRLLQMKARRSGAKVDFNGGFEVLLGQ
ncbi:hypothetical protein [Ancylobacter pratisalsi]|uniref:Exo-alpha-sialidase n=1 Tax=Ancylobacter pratisalsi TaxID=1745854 RepID=A0A6P1YSZ3_9HYPH|nr:hypothetical protein [Ancylobacter pratisalsi]QIB35183.1 hypothetical protein G3A50_16795 [Ancylobacter pratisalsi]